MTRIALVAAFLAAVSFIPTPRVSAAGPTVGGCAVLPADNVWNTPIDSLPVDDNSSAYVNTIGASAGLKADFGSGLWEGGPIGIPYVTVSGSQTMYPAAFEYADESDPGPYAVPLNAPIEGGSQSSGDRHVISIDTTNCILYELFAAYPGSNSWSAGSGAIYDLNSHDLRPETWTSADAAGLPIFPRPRPLRRDPRRPDQPRDPLHRAADPQRLHLAGSPRSLQPHGQSVPAHGPALPPQGQLRHQRILADQSDHPQRAEAVRHDPGR